MELYWVDPKLAVTEKPAAHEDLAQSLAEAHRAGIRVLVSCLQPEEEREIGLDAEHAAARAAGLEFLRFPMHDGGTPGDDAAFDDFVEELAGEYRQGRAIGTHCRHGLGRSPLVTAAVLVRLGLSADEAWRRIAQARGRDVPDNEEQRLYIYRYEARIRPGESQEHSAAG